MIARRGSVFPLGRGCLASCRPFANGAHFESGRRGVALLRPVQMLGNIATIRYGSHPSRSLLEGACHACPPDRRACLPPAGKQGQAGVAVLRPYKDKLQT